MVKTPYFETVLTSSKILKLPVAKGFISKTPWGPFQIIVLALATASVFLAQDLIPQSKPDQPFSIPVSLVKYLILASAANLSPQTKSTGKMMLTFFS